MLNLLHKEYSYAIDAIGKIFSERKFSRHPDKHLAEHLMAYYWRGDLNFNEPVNELENLLNRFFLNASDQFRGHAFSFVGHGLHENKKPVPTKVIERLQRLWLWRMSAVRQSGINITHTEKIAAFGLWFSDIGDVYMDQIF